MNATLYTLDIYSKLLLNIIRPKKTIIARQIVSKTKHSVRNILLLNQETIEHIFKIYP